MFSLFKHKGKIEQPKEVELTGRELLADPAALADWVGQHFLKSRPWQNNLELLPDTSAQEALDITFAEKERFAKENSVLRIVGVLMFMQQIESQDYSEKFLSYLAGELAAAINEPRLEVGQALTDYLRLCVAGDDARVATLYLERIHGQNPNYLRMKISGVGSTGPSTIADTYDIFRDAYWQFRTGYTYAEAMQKVAEAKKVAEAD
ncbi:hypothetical protein ACA097_27830 [Pseudomonas sp. QL9]|uniref:hypothetical protein n=1 Tax=Pseudomonas sp. QL9 TaxID=3242725 RepID=UPI00352B8D28